MSAQHTPGPWHISGSTIKGPHPKDPQNRLRIVAQAVFDKGTWIDETRANARLIAAAPDLLQVVEDALMIFEFGDDDKTVATPYWVARARAAIAKATGSTP
jgi:hypothetical protein